MSDQAEKLKQKFNTFSLDDYNNKQDKKGTHTIAVTSGKGGVGKSNFSLNFSLSLAKQGKTVLLFDLDLGFANIDVLLGLQPKRTLMDMINSDLTIFNIIEKGPLGLQYVAGGSGFDHLFRLDTNKLRKFFVELNALSGHFEYIILDLGAGLSDESLRFMLSSDDIIIVTNPEPTSITDAYAVLKTILANEAEKNVEIVVNRATSEKEAISTSRKLQLVTAQFLQRKINYLGHIPDDPNVSKAVKKQVPFSIEYPNTPATDAITNIANSFLNLPPVEPNGLGGFIKKMFAFSKR